MKKMRQESKIILASASPRRQTFMRHLGLDVEVMVADIDETPQPDEKPIALVQRLAATKAQTVGYNLDCPEPSLIIAADTIVALEDRILGKPTDPVDATDMLDQLRDQPHQVYSGVSLLEITANGLGRQLTQVDTTHVWMRDYTDDEIAAYVASGDPLDKAGAYGIQNRSFGPVERVSGCVTSVIGLPLALLRDMLAEFDVAIEQPLPSICDEYTQFRCCMSLEEGI